MDDDYWYLFFQLLINGVSFLTNKNLVVKKDKYTLSDESNFILKLCTYIYIFMYSNHCIQICSILLQLMMIIMIMI